jgi:NADPH-dependent ferric siderophore reductase
MTVSELAVSRSAVPRLAVEKVRYPSIKARLLRVRQTRRLTPYLLRVTFAGNDLADFVSGSFDDHVKLFLPPAPDKVPAMPVPGPRGLVFPDGDDRPVARDYTPRRYDPDAGELDIDFVLHGHGPAATWAAQASPGQSVGIAGPRGSFVIPVGFDWHLLVGDETAIPAIGRRLEELPARKRALAIIEVSDPSARINFHTRADLAIQWVHCAVNTSDGTSALERAVRRLHLPEGDGYVWAAGEFSAIRNVRHYLVNERGLDKTRVRAASYWRRDAGRGHEVFE